MSDIKIRIWDNKLRKYIAHPMALFSNLHHDKENYEFELWTGHFDRNNVEIYEGDRVKCDPEHITNLLKADKNPDYTDAEVMRFSGVIKVGQAGIGAVPFSDFVTCDCCPCGLTVIGNKRDADHNLKQ